MSIRIKILPIDFEWAARKMKEADGQGNIRLEDCERFIKSMDPFKANHRVGYLGEALYHRVFPGLEYIGDDPSLCSYGDFRIRNTFIDVKTNLSNGVPRPSYWFQITDSNLSRKTNVYAVCQVFKDYSVGYLVGWCWKRTFDEKATFWREGNDRASVDPADPFEFKADTWEIHYGDLDEIFFDYDYIEREETV